MATIYAKLTTHTRNGGLIIDNRNSGKHGNSARLAQYSDIASGNNPGKKNGNVSGKNGNVGNAI